jgi:hypothetical protein
VDVRIPTLKEAPVQFMNYIQSMKSKPTVIPLNTEVPARSKKREKMSRDKPQLARKSVICVEWASRQREIGRGCREATYIVNYIRPSITLLISEQIQAQANETPEKNEGRSNEDANALNPAEERRPEDHCAEHICSCSRKDDWDRLSI